VVDVLAVPQEDAHPSPFDVTPKSWLNALRPDECHGGVHPFCSAGQRLLQRRSLGDNRNAPGG
jgi:hypothetical protein